MCPVAYALLLGKSKETYVRLFTLINAAVQTRIGTEPASRVIQTHFEVAAIQAVRKVYPGADIRGFLFFISHKLWRNVAEKGIPVAFRTNPDLQRYLPRATALPLLPLNQVQDVWMDVLNNSSDLPRLEQFNDYITETWVDDDARFQLVFWNQWANVGLRNNNNLEGFRNKLMDRIQKAHHNPFEFVTHVKEVESTDRAIIGQVNHGGSPPKRRRIYRELDERPVRLKDHLTTGRKPQCYTWMLLDI